jgi:MscS family membrane protein
METWNEIVSYPFFGITLTDVGVALVAIFLGYVLAKIVEVLLSKASERLRPGLRRALLEALVAPAGWAPKLGGIWMAFNLLPIPDIPSFDLDYFINPLAKAASAQIALWFGVRIIDRLCAIWEKKALATEGTFDDQLVPIVRKSTKVFLVITGVVMILQNLGYSVTSLIAGVGLGGAALALASKDTVANLFGSLVIFIDRPFQIGDWVEIGEVEGTVEEVGLRVTLIRTFANSLITVPNAQLTTTAINNWSRMRKRRIKLVLGLTYDTTPAKVEEAVEAIRKVLREDERIDQSFFLVNFTDLGAHSIDIFVYCFTVTTRWDEHLQIRQEVLLKFMRAVKDLGLDFAFPTQTIHLAGMDKPGMGIPPAMKRELPR